jgi:hypothetical protein
VHVKKFALPAIALSTMLTAGLALGLPAARDALAQANAQSPAPAEHGHPGMHEHFVPGRHIEGRLAFLKTELKITDAQAPLWDKVAETMRAEVKERREAFEKMRADHDQPKTLIERLEMRERFGEARVKDTQLFLAALKPLYDSFSADQKKSADELFARHRHGHHHEHH